MAVSVFMPAERPTMHYIRRQALSQSASQAVRPSPCTHVPLSVRQAVTQPVRQSVTKEALEK